MVPVLTPRLAVGSAKSLPPRRMRFGLLGGAVAAHPIRGGSPALTKLPNECPFRWGTVGGWDPTGVLLVQHFWALWGVRFLRWGALGSRWAMPQRSRERDSDEVACKDRASWPQMCDP